MKRTIKSSDSSANKKTKIINNISPSSEIMDKNAIQNTQNNNNEYVVNKLNEIELAVTLMGKTVTSMNDKIQIISDKLLEKTNNNKTNNNSVYNNQIKLIRPPPPIVRNTNNH